MPKWSREYVLAALLAAIAAGLGLGVAVEWLVLEHGREATLSAPPPKAAPPAEGASGDTEDFELPSLDDYEQMTDRPLFMETRRPGAEPGPAALPPPVQTPMTLKLMGIVWTPQGKKALLVDAKGKYKRLKAQDILDNWTLVELGTDKVIMQQGDERKELPLLKKKPKPVNAPGQPGHPGQPGLPFQPGQQPPRPPQPPPPQPIPDEDTGDEGTEVPEEDENTEVPEEDTAPEE